MRLPIKQASVDGRSLVHLQWIMDCSRRPGCTGTKFSNNCCLHCCVQHFLHLGFSHLPTLITDPFESPCCAPFVIVGGPQRMEGWLEALQGHSGSCWTFPWGICCL